MDRFQRIFTLHQLLSQQRKPVSGKRLAAELECSASTVKRVIEEMRNLLNAPIEYDRQHQGYHYQQEDNAPRFELPGLWLSSQEIYALLSMENLLAQLEPGFLDRELGPVRKRLVALQQKISGVKRLDLRRMRILGLGQRAHPVKSFQQIAAALFTRQRIEMDYHSRGLDQTTRRVVSPQRLTHYRHNWYLDAWCHRREALRVFSLERIKVSRVLDQAALEVDERELETQLTSAFGIFSGVARHKAVLRFSPERSRWVADERWHPQQQLTMLADGGCELSFPYEDDRELIQEVLRHGSQVEVLAPAELRERVITELVKAGHIYSTRPTKQSPE